MDDAISESLVSALWMAFPPLFKLIRRRWQRGNKDGFSVYHYEILSILLIRSEMNMSEIGRYLGISKPNLTPIIDSLVNEGLASRSSRAGDRRFIQIGLTDEGKALMLEGKARAKEDIQAVFDGVSNTDQLALTHALQQIEEIVSRLEI
jgi:DNA-binding MarR family transcriptional regulator